MTDGTMEQGARARHSLYLAIVLTAAFAIVTAIVMSGGTAGADRALILSLRSEATPALTAFLLAVTFTSGRLAIPAALVFAVLLYRRSGTLAAAYFVGTCIVAELADAILKYEVHRVRPHGVSPRLTAAGGFAYPSADAMLAVAIFGLGTLMLTWTMRDVRARIASLAFVTLFVMLAAIARVFLGAHWPTDVLGGVLAGSACAAYGVAAYRRSLSAT